MIPDEIIEQVRDSADLVEVIGEAVPLKRTGADWRGACPFHGGSHRNFAVIPKKGMYYCYVCHEAGDVFTWLMKRQGLDYPTAVREVARRVGIVIPERGGREGPDPREPLYTAVAAAQEWFAQRLREDPEANAARSYLDTREVPGEIAGEHGLGYAPRGGGLAAAMRALGIEEAVLLEAGLVVRRDDGTVGPRFRGRLLFPIRDLRGRAVGFGGRLLGPGEPKYLNSPETPIFHKGSILYNLHEAKQAIRREESALLVEGYFDVLRLAMAGVDHVVAPLGTALTPDQAALLRRFTPQVTLLYDSDAAGLRATFRAAQESLRQKLRVRVATLPEGEDPDSLVRTGGSRALAGVLDDALDVLDRQIQILERKGWFEGLEHRREALDRLLPTARAAADPIARELYLTRIAERSGVPRAVLEQELQALPTAAPATPVSARSRGERAPAAGPRQAVAGGGAELQLLEVLVAGNSWRSRAAKELSPELLRVRSLRRLFEALVALPPEEPLATLAARLEGRDLEVLQRLLQSAEEKLGSKFDFDEVYAKCSEHLRFRAQPLPPAAEVAARRAALKALPSEERQRISYQRAGRRPPGRPGPDHTQHR